MYIVEKIWEFVQINVVVLKVYVCVVDVWGFSLKEVVGFVDMLESIWKCVKKLDFVGELIKDQFLWFSVVIGIYKLFEFYFFELFV